MPRILSQSDVADFRERLCVAATRMFDAGGRESFTMRERAAELGVSAMTPYRYFKDKDPDLVRANARARATMTEYVRLMIDAGKFAGDAGLIGHVFWAVLHGTIVLKLAGKLTPEYDFHRISDEASRVVSDAYRPKRA